MPVRMFSSRIAFHDLYTTQESSYKEIKNSRRTTINVFAVFIIQPLDVMKKTPVKPYYNDHKSFSYLNLRYDYIILWILILCYLVYVDRMPPKRTSTSAAPAMTQDVIRQLVADSVATALKAQAANIANTNNTNKNFKTSGNPVARKGINDHKRKFKDKGNTTNNNNYPKHNNNNHSNNRNNNNYQDNNNKTQP
ncbi:hypothetical protein Tco_0217070 [Tanacetum coccineum]